MATFTTRCLLLCLLFLAGAARAFDAPAAWMRADWTGTAPHLRDAGVDPKALGAVIGKRLLVFRQAPRTVLLPGPHGQRRYDNARFVTAVARVDMPPAQARRLLFNFAGYKDAFPLVTQSEVQAIDGRNVVTRYRIEMPLPVASFGVDFRVKNRLEDDGSISSTLIDGEARSFLAMLGGMTESLADQPQLSRWEIFPLDADHALIAFSLWDQVQFKSWLANLVRRQYPEMTEIAPYVGAAGALEALRSRYSFPDMSRESEQAPGHDSLEGLAPVVQPLLANGQVVVYYPDPGLRPADQAGYLRYVSVISRMDTAPERARSLLTDYARYPEFTPEIRKVTVRPTGNGKALDLKLRIGLTVIDFPLAVSLQTQEDAHWRIPFHRTAGEVEKIYGAAELGPDGKGADFIASSAIVLGDDAPWLLRMFHKMVNVVPYAGDITMMVVEQITLMRMRTWVEKQAAPVAAK